MTPSNPLKLQPTALMRRVNQAGFGTVLSESRLKTHRQSDVNSADGKSVDLLKYAAWLTIRFFQDENKTQDYKERKRKQAEKNADEVRAAQDIGPLPEVADPKRKKAALKSFRVFCDTYFGEVFYLPWSEDHLRVIKKIERSVTKGGLFAMRSLRSPTMLHSIARKTANREARSTRSFRGPEAENALAPSIFILRRHHAEVKYFFVEKCLSPSKKLTASSYPAKKRRRSGKNISKSGERRTKTKPTPHCRHLCTNIFHDSVA